MYDTKCIMKISDYYKPTPTLFRKIGDTILVGCTSLAAMMMGTPIEEHTKTWLIFSLNVFGVMGKMVTNFFKEDETKNPE